VAGATSTTLPANAWLDATGTAARFGGPVGIACDIQGNVYIADALNNRIRKMDPGGVVTTVAGSTPGYLDATGSSAEFYQPNGVAIDSAGYLYVADTIDERIRRISPAGVVTTVAATGTLGSADGPGNVATFTGPFAIADNRTGDVIVGGADSAIRLIQRVVNSGTQ
jgi:streptogramin lyase